MPVATDTTRRHRRLTSTDHRRLLDVMVRRACGQTWSTVATELGWRSKQAAQRWSARALDKYWNEANRR